MNFEKKAFDLKCTMRLEREGSPEEIKATGAWLRKFAAEVLREGASHYGMMIDHSRPPEDVMLLLNRRAKSIEDGA